MKNLHKPFSSVKPLTPEERLMYHQLRRLAVPEVHRSAARRYYQRNKSACNERCKLWREKNPRYQKEWSRKNQEKSRGRWKRYHKRHHDDINYRIRKTIGCRLAAVVRGNRKFSRTLSILGCSIADFRIYIESRFEPEMTWGNYGEWHLDHIAPCALFDFSKRGHVKACFHFSNYRPLWKRENLRRDKKAHSQMNLRF